MSNPVTPADAVLAMAQAAVPGVTVFDAHVPKSTEAQPLPARYVVIYPATPQLSWEDLGVTADTYRHEWQTTAVASTRPEVEWLTTRLRDAFVGNRAAVAGMDCAPIEHLGSQPVRWDDQIPSRVALYGTDQYAFDATAT